MPYSQAAGEPNMAQPQVAPSDNWTRKRRSQRIAMSVPVVAYRLPKVGKPFYEGSHTLALNAHGALISLATVVAENQKLFLKHALSGEEQECRVVSIQKKPNGPTEVGIEFRRPSPGFWRIAFPPGDWKRPQ